MKASITCYAIHELPIWSNQIIRERFIAYYSYETPSSPLPLLVHHRFSFLFSHYPQRFLLLRSTSLSSSRDSTFKSAEMARSSLLIQRISNSYGLPRGTAGLLPRYWSALSLLPPSLLISCSFRTLMLQ